MRRKRNDESVNEILNQEEVLKITKIDDIYLFELDGESTSDVAEAVSILMDKIDWDDQIWNISIGEKNKKVSPVKSLFWLSGGYDEWIKLYNYTTPWSECHSYFNNEFGSLIIYIVSVSNTLLDVRNGFMKYLSLPVLYDFAISKNIVR